MNIKKVYFDSINGDDSFSGDINFPYKSLEKLNNIIREINQNTKILIKRNSKFVGNLNVCSNENQGNSKFNLYIETYGNGKKPFFDGNGNKSAIEINRSNLRIKDVEVVNKDGLIGIFVNVNKKGTLKELIIENCYVHDVNWNEQNDFHEKDILKINPYDICPKGKYYYETGGIIFIAQGDDPCNYENITLKNNRIVRVSRSGIFLTSIWIRRPGTPWGKNCYYDDEHEWYPSKNINIYGNKVLYSGGDGIVLVGSKKSKIEKNISYHSNYLGREGNANAGIWCIGCLDVLFQYNEAAYSHLEHGGLDGEGFDIDIANQRIVFQYNYSHDNDGGGILLCNARTKQPKFDINKNPILDEKGNQVEYEKDGIWKDNVIRNNIFVNNGKEWDNPSFIHFSSTCNDLLVHNNTIINSHKMNNQLIIRTADYANCGHQNNITYYNNIFYAPCFQTSKFKMDYCDNYIFNNNLYINLDKNQLKNTNEKSIKIKTMHPIMLSGSLNGFKKALEISNNRIFTSLKGYGANIL